MFSSTIKPYKFVNPSSISVKGGGATIIAGGKTITGGMSPQVKSARVTMLAINRIGLSMQSLGKTQQQIRDIIVHENSYLVKSSDFKKKREGYRRDQKSEARSESFGKKEKDNVAKEVVKKEKKQLGWLEKIFGPFAGIISFATRFVITQTVLRWMANPTNTDKLVVFVKSFGKIFKWAFNIAYKSTDAVLSGFAKVFGSSDKKGLDRFGEVLGGLGQLLIGIAGFKALGYLLNPFSLVNDIIGLVDSLDSGGKSTDLPDGGGKPSAGKPDPKLKGAQERYFKKYGRDAFIKRFGEEGLKNLPRNMQRTALQQFGRNTKALGIRTTQKVLGKGVSKALGKIPIIGPVIDFAIRTLIFKEPLGKAAASAVGAGIGQGIGGAIGTAGAAALAGGTFGVGLAAAPIIIGASSLIGGFVGDYIGSKLYDWIAPFFSKDKTPQLAKGGIVTKPTRAIIGEKGPEAVIPLSKLGGTGVAATIIGATQSALSRMGAAGEIAKALIGPDLNAAENIFGSSKVGGGDTLGKSVMKASKVSLMGVDAGSGISILLGQENITINDTKNPSNKPTTLRGQLANVLSALIWVSKKNISGGGGTGGPGTAGGGNTGSPPGNIDLKGNSNAEKVFRYFVDKEGFTPEAAAGIIGNLMQESGVNPKSRQLGGGPGRGIMQWSESERWASMQQWAKGKDPWALDTQVQWMIKEMKDYGTYTRIKNVKDHKKAVEIFESEMEKAGTPNYPARYAFAASAYGSFGGTKKMSQGGLLKAATGARITAERINQGKGDKSAGSSGTKILKVPYFNQRQNKTDSFGTGGDSQCFSTSAAMVVSAVTGTTITPDKYNSIRSKYGPSTSMGSHPPAMSKFGVPASGGDTGSYKKYKSLIDAGKPVILGLQHNSGSGHMVVGIGYKGDDIVVHDPFGRLNPTPKGGWQSTNLSGKNDTKGKGVVYPKSLMDGIWLDRGPGTGRIIAPSKGGVGSGGIESVGGDQQNISPDSQQQIQEEPESLESLFSKLESAVSGLNTSLGYTPVEKPTTPSTKPTTAAIKPTTSASSSGSQMTKVSEDVTRLEEAAQASQNTGQFIPLPINTSSNVPAAFSGQQVYYPRTPITYGL